MRRLERRGADRVGAGLAARRGPAGAQTGAVGDQDGLRGPPRAQSIKQCVDPETDAIMQSSATNIGSQCSKRDVVKSGDTMTIDSVCSVAGHEASSHAVVNGSFDSDYTMTVASKSDIGPINMTIAGKWLGPCEAGQKPGDLILPGGMKLNLRDMANRPGGPGGPPPAPR